VSTRREFLQVVALAGGGFALGIRLGADDAVPAATPFRPNAWVRVEPDGRIVVVVGKSEMGQGPRTSLPMLVAEELEVGLDQIELEQASPSPEYDDLGTGGSSSITDGWDPLRRAGAAARTMLIAAAATRWQVAPENCRAERGRVVEVGGERSLSYGELAADAARQPAPAEPALKPRSAYRLIGTAPPRTDGPDLVTGRARYGLDVRLPGMLFAVVARPPVLGGSVESFDAAETLATPGVTACFRIPSGIAVAATSTWAALRGRDALRVKWIDGEHADFSSRAHVQQLTKLSEQPGITTRKEGRGRAALAGAAQRHEALYLYPFEAHASVEPVNSTCWIHDGQCEVWSPTQLPMAAQVIGARLLGIPPDKVTVHVTLLGGGFGRRLGWDFDVEAIEVARQLDAPVQLVWTRQDDHVHGYFQSATAERLAAGFDHDGKIVAWEHRKVATPHNARGKPTPVQLANAEFLAGSSWGVTDSPYLAPHLETSYAVADCPVPIGPWRAVFAPSSVFARECFVDELAEMQGVDPIAMRRRLVGDGEPDVPPVQNPGGRRVDRRRLLRVLDRVAEKIGWTTPPRPGVARGIACDVFHTETYVAYAVEVSRTPGRLAELPFRIERVVGAVDCGVVIHRDGVVQQVESGVIWSLSNLKTEITFENGRAQQENFDSFQVLRIGDLPEIEVHIVDSDDERPHGLGEPPVSPLAPAVVNALSRLLGKRFRKLPIVAADLA